MMIRMSTTSIRNFPTLSLSLSPGHLSYRRPLDTSQDHAGSFSKLCGQIWLCCLKASRTENGAELNNALFETPLAPCIFRPLCSPKIGLGGSQAGKGKNVEMAAGSLYSVCAPTDGGGRAAVDTVSIQPVPPAFPESPFPGCLCRSHPAIRLINSWNLRRESIFFV